MNKRWGMIRLILLIAIVVIGCSSNEKPAVSSEPMKNQEVPGSGETSQEVTFRAEVLEMESGLLVIPDEDSNEFRSSDRMTVNYSAAKLVGKDGNETTTAQIKFGDILLISYNGAIAESYPAQITATKIEITGHDDLTDGYLALIDNIYQEDEGLNSDIEMIALDTTEWIEADQTRKAMIFEKVKNNYGFEVKEATYDDLVEQGLIEKDNLYFPKGILIKLSNMKYDETENTITCSISKWRSGLGAVGSDTVTATLMNSEWKITKESSWIS